MPIGPDFYALFLAKRLQPQNPDHAKLIKGFLAQMEVMSPEKIKDYAEHYQAVHTVVALPSEPVTETTVTEITEEKPVEPKPKKQGRRKKADSPLPPTE